MEIFGKIEAKQCTISVICVDVGNAHLVYLSASSGYFPEMMC
jgi:hypothetical protein